MKHFEENGSDSEDSAAGSTSDNESPNATKTPASDAENNSSNEGGSDNESHNTSRTTKSSDNNESRNKEEDDEDESDDEEKQGSDNEASGSGSGSGSDSGTASGSDSDSNAGSDSDDNKSEDSDDNKSDDSSEDDNKEGSDDEGGSGSGDNSDSSYHSDNNRRSKRKQEPAWERDPDMYGVRRSARDRRQPDRIALQLSEATRRGDGETRRRRSPDQWNSSESDEDDTYASRSHLRRSPPKPAKGALAAAQRRASQEQRQAKRSSRSGGKVSYKEDESESEESDISVAEDEQQIKEPDDENTQNIEKIIDQRIGKKGAVGMQTYLYDVEKKGDPNSDFDPHDPMQAEKHFLVKWKGWAHLHNTWESEESLKTQKVKGLKKLENFLRKEEELVLWKNSATPEEIEYMEIQSELERDLNLSHLKADRIFAEAEERGNNFYYVKWEGLPYSESTWELETLIKDRFPEKIEMFHNRERSSCTPRQCPALKHRPKYSHIKEQPEYLGGEKTDLILRDYQMQGLNWLVHAWCKHNSVILADEMGLGKTIQAISFISNLFHVHHMYGPYLFVLPLSTLNAWEREFSLWAPDINVIVYIGDRDSRKIIRDYEWSFSSKRLKFNVVLTTYEIVLRDKDELKECLWSVMAIDEAHRLKNEESQLYQALKEFRSNHRLLITGTPLQNSLKELWALLHFIMPEKFDDWSYFESQHDKHKEKGFHKLHKQLEPFLLRRVKKDVEKSLPSKVEQILRVDMTKEQKQYYKWILTKNYEMLKKGNRGSTSTFVNIVMELKKCCNHSFLTKPPEEIPSGTTEMLQQILRGSGKLVLLDKLLLRLHETGHRVLIFSQMVRQLDILSQYLQLRRLNFQRLDGSIRGELRKQALEHFNAEGSSDFCFLLSTRAGGLGINLATADTVIIFDSDWNPQNDLQAQARAHRIGQKNQVNIYRLVTKNSIEENIIERAKQKMVLDHLVIQSMDTSGRTVFNKKMSSGNSNPFNKEELNAILKFGADELFKDSDEENDEPVCDIDEILRRAETREDGPASAGDDLLSAFKVASINLDEDEEVSRLDSNADEKTNKDWDEIIPETYLKEIKEEEKAKEMADLYLPPRSRKTVQNPGDPKAVKEESCSASSDSEKDEDGSPRKRGRGRPVSQAKEKETIKGFTEAEVRRFFRSMKRFSNPLRRLDTISRDADLREKPLPDLKRLADTILDHCKEFMAELERAHQDNPEKEGPPRRGKHSGNSFKLSGVSINAKTTLSALDELAPLDTIVPHAPVQRASWLLPIKKVKDTHWDTTWTIQDDSRLLCGIYEYGMGSWEQMKADPALNLGDKILLDGDLKPQAKQLETRAQYLLKLIKKHNGNVHVKQPPRAKPPKAAKAKAHGKIKEPIPISREIIDDDTSDDEASNVTVVSSTSAGKRPSSCQEGRDKDHGHKDNKDHVKDKDAKVKTKGKEDKTEKEDSSKGKEKDEVKDENSHHKKKKDKKDKKPKEKSKGPVHITANGEPMPILDDTEMDTNHPMWYQCKEKMRPMRKFLMELSSGGGDNISQEQQIAHTKRCLLTIGDHITAVISSGNPDHQDSWKVLLWRFVSKFTEYDAKKLHKFYKKTKKHELIAQESGEKSATPETNKEKTKEQNNKEHISNKEQNPKEHHTKGHHSKEHRSKEHRKKEHHKEHHNKHSADQLTDLKENKDSSKESSQVHRSQLKRPHESEENSEHPAKKSFNGSASDNSSRDKWQERDNKRERDHRDRDMAKDGRDSRGVISVGGGGDSSRDSGVVRDSYRDRDRSRDRDRDRSNDRNGGGGGYQRRGGGRHRDGWHNKRDNRYPQGGYHRDGYNDGGYGGYQRGGIGDWRGGGRPQHKHSNYGGPPHPSLGGGYALPPQHYPPISGPMMGGGPPLYGPPPIGVGGPPFPPFRGDWGPRCHKGREVDPSGGGNAWPQHPKDRNVEPSSSRADPRTASNRVNASGDARGTPPVYQPPAGAGL